MTLLRYVSALSLVRLVLAAALLVVAAAPASPIEAGAPAQAAPADLQQFQSGGQVVVAPNSTWHTFLGGGGYDMSCAMAVDGSGNVYVTGRSHANWGQDPVRNYAGGDGDAFVAKLDSDGNLIWHTFLGGNDWDESDAIAVDQNGNVYVTGHSYAAWGSPVRAYTVSLIDAFVAKLDHDGNLTWHTFLGGSDWDEGAAIAVDQDGNVHVTGYSDATWGSPLRPYTAGFRNALVAKLDEDGNLTWHTFLGGSDEDDGLAIVLSEDGNIYVAGFSCEAWGENPVRAYTAGCDAFVAELDHDGYVVWHTFLGGSGLDHVNAIVMDDDEDIYVEGCSNTSWGDEPVRAFSGETDAFAARLDNDGSLTWNTFLGGSGDDWGFDIAVDSGRNLYVTGYSRATWGENPVHAYAGNSDATVVKLNNDGGLSWNTFLGGSDNDYGTGIVADGSRCVYLVGDSHATWGENPVRAYTGSVDVFTTKMCTYGTYLPTLLKVMPFQVIGPPF